MAHKYSPAHFFHQAVGHEMPWMFAHCVPCQWISAPPNSDREPHSWQNNTTTRKNNPASPLRYETVPRQLQMRKPMIPPLYNDEQPSPWRRLEPKRQLKPPLVLMLSSALPDQLPKIKGESKCGNIYYLFNPVPVSIEIHLQHNSSQSPLPGEHNFTSCKEVQNFSCKLW